jgi:hypothetical protein
MQSLTRASPRRSPFLPVLPTEHLFGGGGRGLAGRLRYVFADDFRQVMGAEIAAAHIKHNLPVTIFDSNPASLSTIAARTSAELAAGCDDRDQDASVGRLLRPAGELAEVAKCDLIIETILEKLPAKQELFASSGKYSASGFSYFEYFDDSHRKTGREPALAGAILRPAFLPSGLGAAACGNHSRPQN